MERDSAAKSRLFVLHASPPLIGYVPPLEPTLVEAPPNGPEWIHEIKHDGYRSLVAINGDDVRVFTKKGHDYTRQFAPIAAAAAKLGCPKALLDGETIVQDETGRSDFRALRGAIAGEPHRLVFYGFDALWIDGEDLRRMGCEERRARLHALLGSHDPASPLQFSEAVNSDGGAVLEMACQMGLEGIVSKRRDSKYRSGKSLSWLKTKCLVENTYVVIGAEHEPGKPAFALLASEDGPALNYVGSAFVTLGGADRDRFWDAVERHAAANPPLNLVGHKKARWVRPEIRVRVEHLKEPGKLRHAKIRELVAL